MTDAHARLSPSAANGWFACPGRLRLEDAFPNNANTYSDDGTACHAVAAWCLTEHWQASKRVGDWITVSSEGEPLRQVKFTDDMAELTQEYVNYVRFASIGNELLVEQRLEHSNWVAQEGQFGTTDAGIVNRAQGELMVVDLKAGYVPVEARGNKQLRIYALSLLGDLYEKAMAAVAQTQETEAEDFT